MYPYLNKNYLQKSLKTVHICEKAKRMITLLAAYSVFWELLDRERIYQDDSLDFSTVCDYIGIDRVRLDALLLEETGMCGQDILAHFRSIDFPGKMITFAKYSALKIN